MSGESLAEFPLLEAQGGMLCSCDVTEAEVSMCLFGWRSLFCLSSEMPSVFGSCLRFETGRVLPTNSRSIYKI